MTWLWAVMNHINSLKYKKISQHLKQLYALTRVNLKVSLLFHNTKYFEARELRRGSNNNKN